MKRYLMLIPLLSCAELKPIPTQTLTCLKAEANAGNAVKAAECLAAGGTSSQVESCYLGIAEGVGLDMLQCEALAIWGDLHHAQTVAVATGSATATLQANAKAYLIAKDIAAP
jgi:hypothetical protein